MLNKLGLSWAKLSTKLASYANCGHLPLKLSSIEVVFHQGCLPLRLSLNEVIPLMSSTVEVVGTFLGGG